LKYLSTNTLRNEWAYSFYIDIAEIPCDNSALRASVWRSYSISTNLCIFFTHQSNKLIQYFIDSSASLNLHHFYHFILGFCVQPTIWNEQLILFFRNSSSCNLSCIWILFCISLILQDLRSHSNFNPARRHIPLDNNAPIDSVLHFVPFQKRVQITLWSLEISIIEKCAWASQHYLSLSIRHHILHTLFSKAYAHKHNNKQIKIYYYLSILF
jgi:hypothetical protein